MKNNAQKLNLEPIIIKAMDTEEGHGWSFDHALRVAEEYRKYLELCKLYPNEAVVPSNLVDDFWHLHILDTQKYAEDCQQYFGYFLHHFPYFGMRGEADAQNLENAWEKTKALYEKHFGKIPEDLWQGSKRCPNCGRRIEGNSMIMDKRPSFEDYQLNA